jgi:SAM-dependent methyltransferase
MTTDTIRADFDRLARLDDDGWNHNRHYHPYLLKHIPSTCDQALEIGCGTGSFARRLAQRARRVLALDLSPAMVGIATARSCDYTNIEYQIADVNAWGFPRHGFDVIASIATLHHLPLDSLLKKMSDALKPGGVLLILDLYEAETLSEKLPSLAALPASVVLQLFYTGRIRSPDAVRQAWAEHGKHDAYLRLSQVRQACAAVIPNAVIKRHLLWRYSIVWRKPPVPASYRRTLPGKSEDRGTES